MQLLQHSVTLTERFDRARVSALNRAAAVMQNHFGVISLSMQSRVSQGLRVTSVRRLYPSAQAPLIAVVGSDGSGKSTVSSVLLDWLGEQYLTEYCHLGKKTGHWGRAIARLPLMGKRLDRKIVKTTHSARAQGRVGPLSAVVVFALSMRRVLKFRRMLRVRRTGAIIVTDRYPQVAVPGPMDGPGLFLSPRDSLVARVLGRLEHRLYAWMASHPPDLVIRLNIDLQTAIDRKPDHRASSLERKVADVPRLKFVGSRVIDLDGTQPLESVIRTAKAAVADLMPSSTALSC